MAKLIQAMTSGLKILSLDLQKHPCEETYCFTLMHGHIPAIEWDEGDSVRNIW
jgi:hypothetical protein